MADLTAVMLIRMQPEAKAKATKTAADRGVGHAELVRAAVAHFVELDPVEQQHLLGTSQQLALDEGGERAVKAS